MAPKGTGLGFRRELLDQLDRTKDTPVDFFEIAPENWLDCGGSYRENLRRYTDQYPFTCHGLSLSIGSSDPLDISLLRKIKQFMQEHQIDLYTEHLSWCSYQGHLYDLLPIPFNEESARWVIQRVKQVQDVLETTIALENASYYFRPPGSTMEEADFIHFIIDEAQCGLHLDVNNIYVNSKNFGFDADEYLKRLPLKATSYIHVAGHYVEDDGFIVDTHGNEVITDVWNLLETAYQAIGNGAGDIPTCLERDFNFPEISTLFEEVEHIRSIQKKFSRKTNKQQVEQHG